MCLFLFRRRDAAAGRDSGAERSTYRMPGHPVTTILFIGVCWAVVGVTLYRYPANALIGFGILLAGIPIYFLWRRMARSAEAQ